MSNLTRAVDGVYTIAGFVADVRQAMRAKSGVVKPVVGVFIQYGQSGGKKGGGHVCPFVIDENGELQAWDEICRKSWHKTIDNSVNVLQQQHPTHMLAHSSSNHVIAYVHPANKDQVKKVRERAERLADEDNQLKYGKIAPTAGFSMPSNKGNCVSRSSWVMAAFSTSVPFRGFVSPWGQTVSYEVYTMGVNFMSSWYKIKYKNSKLPVMNNMKWNAATGAYVRHPMSATAG